MASATLNSVKLDITRLVHGKRYEFKRQIRPLYSLRNRLAFAARSRTLMAILRPPVCIGGAYGHFYSERVNLSRADIAGEHRQTIRGNAELG
jgi:hypothetical protein